LLVPNLPAFLKGVRQPSDNEERLTLAVACRARGLHRTAASLFADAFVAEPGRAEDPRAGCRYAAACSAARAGADTASPQDPDRARWRMQALRWLKEELAMRTRQQEGGISGDRAQVRATMRQWEVEPDLVRARDPYWIAGLAAEERQEWTNLWAAVGALAAQEPGPPRQ
jgi:hypothetical protein